MIARGRKIVVDGVAYQWKLVYGAILVAPSHKGPKRVLRVQWRTKWVPDADYDWDLDQGPSLTPKHVADLIHGCLAQGYDPKVPGSEFNPPKAVDLGPFKTVPTGLAETIAKMSPRGKSQEWRLRAIEDAHQRGDVDLAEWLQEEHEIEASNDRAHARLMERLKRGW